MKICVVGGGPAGLYFSLLWKRRHPDADIEIWERNPPDNTFGWGLVFSESTLSNLEQHDEASYQAIQAAFRRWENVDVIHQGEKISIGGNRFVGISRIALLRILQDRCRELGVRIHFEREVDAPEELKAGCDLLLGADGVGSVVRDTWSEAFQPSLDVRPNRYIWLGTPRLFHGLTLSFRQGESGWFAAHAYKFSEERSTFIAECTPETAAEARLEDRPVEEALRELERVFADDLRGEPLLSNQSRWIRFPLLTCGSWVHENVVLLGDAMHTAHFSIGSGTKLALEDAISLAGSLEEAGQVAAGLGAFEARRRPEVEELQEAALESMVWFENFEDDLHLDPVSFAYRVMTRSSKVDRENLRRRDPEFVARWESLQEG